MRGNCTPLCVEEVHAVRSAQSWFPPIIKAMLYLLCSQLESPPSKLSVPETHCASTSAPPISPDPSPKTMSAHHCVPLAYTIYARANVGSPIGPNPPNSCWRICSCTPNDPRYPATILSKQCKQCLPLLMALGPPSTQSTLEMMLLWPRHKTMQTMLTIRASIHPIHTGDDALVAPPYSRLLDAGRSLIKALVAPEAAHVPHLQSTCMHAAHVPHLQSECMHAAHVPHLQSECMHAAHVPHMQSACMPPEQT